MESVLRARQEVEVFSLLEALYHDRYEYPGKSMRDLLSQSVMVTRNRKSLTR